MEKRLKTTDLQKCCTRNPRDTYMNAPTHTLYYSPKLGGLSLFIYDRMNSLQCIETVEYSAAIKRNKLRMHTTPWVTFTILSKRGKTLKITLGIIPFIKVQSQAS